MIVQIISFLGLIVGIVLLYKLNPIKVDPFLRKEAKRGLFNNFEADDSWNSEGRVYGNGLALVNKDGKKKFIIQSKLVDSGLLHN